MNEESLSQVDNLKEKLRGKILSTLIKKDLTQSDLARMMGHGRSSIGNYLKSDFDKTSINKLVEILDTLGVRVNISFSDE